MFATWFIDSVLLYWRLKCARNDTGEVTLETEVNQDPLVPVTADLFLKDNRISHIKQSQGLLVS